MSGGAHPADSAIFGHLWSTPEASALFTDEGRTQAWLQILAALAQAQADVGPDTSGGGQDDPGPRRCRR